MSDMNETFSEKYDLYGKTIFKIAMTYLGNKSDAEDVMQEVFIKLLYHAPEFKSKDYEKYWIIRTTSNICKNMLKSFWHKNTDNLEGVSEYFSGQYETNIAELLFQLEPKYRIVLYLMYYEGYSIKEIADMLSVSQSAVKMRLKRGREMLKLDIEEGYLYEKTGFHSHNV